MKTPIEIVTEYQLATSAWFAVREGEDGLAKIAAWQRLKLAESAKDAQEDAHAQQMKLATRRPR